MASPPKQKQEREMALNPSEFINQVRAEARKVIWPTRAETTSTAIFVGIMMVLLAVFFLGVDALFRTVVRLLLSLA
jgi:preprotein translocase subunit SecE